MDELRKVITEKLHWLGLLSTDIMVDAIAERVTQDADDLWNEWDVIIAIRNEINEMIERRDA